MFSFFKKKSGKAEHENARKLPTAIPSEPVERSPPSGDVTKRKDVVNLLLPDTNYKEKSGVSAFLDIMAGRRKKKKGRAESCRVSPQREIHNLQRSKSDVEPIAHAPTTAKNTQDTRAPDDPADFVKALVLEKYANKTPNEKHVSLVYVNEPDLDGKRHAEALLREIARSIDCTIDDLNVQMGTTESRDKQEPVYETLDNNNTIDAYKNDLKDELSKLLQEDNFEEKIDDEIERPATVTDSTESLAFKKKSNLKPPRSDNEGCSDDDRSDCGKKKVTFRKHIVFDDGDQQTDEEVDSSFETISSEEEEEFLEDSLPDNDELLGGVVVSRSEDNKTVISVNDEPIQINIENVDEELKINSSDNSDSGFVEISEKCDVSEIKSIEVESESNSEVSESETEEEVEEEVEEVEEEEIEEIEEEIEIEEEVLAQVVEPSDDIHHAKSLVTQESKFQSQVAALTELADSRCGETERARELIAACRKEIEEKDNEIEKLKCDLAAAYKESEAVRQRSCSLEQELAAARSSSAVVAEQHRRNDESVRQLRGALEDAENRRAELESKVLALEKDRDRLQQEKELREQKAQEAISAAEANTAKWRSAHEAARSQAAARAELMLADCEWKMRELEKRARGAEALNKQLNQKMEELKTAPPNPSHIAELQQLRGLATEQQRSVQALTLQLQKVETREEALKLEMHRLKELLEKETIAGKQKEERHLQTVERLVEQHSKAIETLKQEHLSTSAASRAAAERAHAERTRAALAQLRAEAERDSKNADRRLREVTTKFENLKEELSSKEANFEQAITEAHSKADWDILQLRHMLDKADINYANNVEKMSEKFEKEIEQLNEEWSNKLKAIEEQATTAAEEARNLLETTRTKLILDKNEQINNLKEQHRNEMDDQWEQFMIDKENCLTRMKAECRQEGEEERVKREKDLLEEIAELRSEIQSKSVDFEHLETKNAACGRTLAVTEQELREALDRAKELREMRSEDATKMKQLERASRDQIEHLTRKCACVRKLFDDMRARLVARERTAEQEAKAKEKELHHLKAEVARLTKLLMEQNSPKLEARTRADGCEMEAEAEAEAGAVRPPRRKGGSLKTPEAMRKRLLPELQPLPPEARRPAFDEPLTRRRAKSVDLPAVQVPVRIKQLEEKTRDN